MSEQPTIQDGRNHPESGSGSRVEVSALGLSSAWVTLLIFILIAHFNPEVLTGSTPIEKYFQFTNFLGMLFYGLQVAVIADLAARYSLRWRTIFIVGLIYGVFEEGFAVMTMESPTPPGMTNILRIAGLNVAWTAYIAVFHAVVSVLCSILIIKLIWPRRISSPFLKRRHYMVIVPVLALIYIAFIRFVSAIYTPEGSAIAILGVTCLVLAYFAKRSQSSGSGPPDRAMSYRLYVAWALVLVLLSGLAPFLLAASTAGGFFVPFLELLCAFFFVLLFDRWEHEQHNGQRKGLVLFAVFVGFWLVFPTLSRTPLSSLVAYAGVAVQLYLGWRSVRGERPQQRSLASSSSNVIRALTMHRLSSARAPLYLERSRRRKEPT